MIETMVFQFYFHLPPAEQQPVDGYVELSGNLRQEIKGGVLFAVFHVADIGADQVCLFRHLQLGQPQFFPGFQQPLADFFSFILHDAIYYSNILVSVPVLLNNFKRFLSFFMKVY